MARSIASGSLKRRKGNTACYRFAAKPVEPDETLKRRNSFARELGLARQNSPVAKTVSGALRSRLSCAVRNAAPRLLATRRISLSTVLPTPRRPVKTELCAFRPARIRSSAIARDLALGA